MGINQVINRIRSWQIDRGVSISHLARQSKVSRRTLCGLHDPGWNPRADTLEKLEAVMPPNYRPRKKPRRAAE